MNKYITPTIEYNIIESADVITTSGGVKIGTLEGVDTEDSVSAIFDANFFAK